MPYARWDDKFHRHPKRKLLSLAADGLATRASSYIAEHLTDGFVPEKWLREEIDGADIAPGLSDRLMGRARAALLEEVTRPLPPRGHPLFETVDGGYLLHDYLEHNPTAAVVEAQRDKNRKRQADFRSGVTNGVTHPRSNSVTAGSGSGVPPETTEETARVTPADAPDDKPPLTDAGTPTDEVLQILRSCRRLFVDDLDARFAVENAVQSAGGWGQNDVLAAARYAASVAVDPTWRMTNIGSLMSHALGKVKADPTKGGGKRFADERIDYSRYDRAAQP